jgi:cobalt-precorrin 5A hydrolase/precorrin-3B C17-methyltransferase
LEILARHRDPSTPVGVVTDVGRATERVEITSLAALDPGTVGMTTCVVVGATSTRVEAGRVFTPRGYGR